MKKLKIFATTLILALSPCEKAFATPENASAISEELADSGSVLDGLVSADVENNDPLEPLNRILFGFNEIFDGTLLKPISIMYRGLIPEYGRNGVANFIDNIFSPIVFVNHVLQGQGERAMTTVVRFFINSTIGLLGLFDAAKEIGMPGYEATFNQTLTVWGADTGPYLMLPFLGPSSVRGVMGIAGEYYMNPLTYYVKNKHHRYNHYGQQRYILYALYGLDIVGRRAKLIDALNDLERNSVDYYTAIRTIYFQRQKTMKEEIAKHNEAPGAKEPKL